MNEAPIAEHLRVLLVEDSADDAFFLVRQLRKGGYEPEYLRVDTTTGTRDALAQGGWDLLISDYHLPRFNALDVLAMVREFDLDLPIIVISGAIGEDLAVETMHAGAHDYIMKDNLARFLPAVQRELDEARMRRQRRDMERALRESEQRFRELTETIGEVFWMVDFGRDCMSYVSPAYERVWLRSSEPLLRHLSAFLDTVHPEDYDRVQGHLEQAGWDGFDLEYRIQRPDGSERWVHTRCFPIREADGSVQRVAGLSVDVTERYRLISEAQKLSRGLEQTADAVMILDAQGCIEYVNAAFEDISGYGRAEVIGRTPRFLRSGFQDEAFFTQVWRTLRNGLPFTDVFISRRKDGELFYEEKTLAPVRDGAGNITHYVSTGRDITRRLRMQQRLQQVTSHDAVTGLANRILFMDRLHQAVVRARRMERMVGVLCVGVNLAGLFGGESAELEAKVLPLVAERLRAVVGSEDVVARLAADEFAVLRCEVQGKGELEGLAGRLLQAFAEAVRFDGYELFLNPSVGISFYPRDSDESAQLIQNASQAMRETREQRQAGYRFFSGPNGPEHRLPS